MFNTEFLSYLLVNNWYLWSGHLCLVYITKRTKKDRSVYHPFKGYDFDTGGLSSTNPIHRLSTKS